MVPSEGMQLTRIIGILVSVELPRVESILEPNIGRNRTRVEQKSLRLRRHDTVFT